MEIKEIRGDIRLPSVNGLPLIDVIVELPDDFSSVEYEQNGIGIFLVTGTKNEMLKFIMDAGYTVSLSGIKIGDVVISDSEVGKLIKKTWIVKSFFWTEFGWKLESERNENNSSICGLVKNFKKIDKKEKIDFEKVSTFEWMEDGMEEQEGFDGDYVHSHNYKLLLDEWKKLKESMKCPKCEGGIICPEQDPFSLHELKKCSECVERVPDPEI
jgi:hypothetical protein